MGKKKQRGHQMYSISGDRPDVAAEQTSRTKKKKAARAMQKLGEQLVHLSEAQFNALELPDELMEAAAMARRIKQHEARRRQLQYIGRLMRHLDFHIIEEAIQRVVAGENENKRRFKLVERWRDELIDGGNECLKRLIDTYPQIDARELDLLVNEARGLNPRVDSKKASRKLFRYLSKLG